MNKQTLSKRESNKLNCRKQILKASRRLFTSKGYDNTMMEDIAAKANVSKATLYNYFPNKESLLTGTIDSIYDSLMDVLATLDGQSSEQKLRRILGEFIHESLQYPSLSRRITYLQASNTSSLYGSGDRVRTLIRDLITASISEGAFAPGADAKMIMDALWSMYLLALYRWEDIDWDDTESFWKCFDTHYDSYTYNFRTAK